MLLKKKNPAKKLKKTPKSTLKGKLYCPIEAFYYMDLLLTENLVTTNSKHLLICSQAFIVSTLLSLTIKKWLRGGVVVKRILCASLLFISSFQFILGKKPKVPGNILQVTQHGGFSSENPLSAVHAPTTMEHSAMNSPTSVECSVVHPPSASPTSIEVNTSLSDSASVHSACSPLPVHADVGGCTVNRPVLPWLYVLWQGRRCNGRVLRC